VTTWFLAVSLIEIFFIGLDPLQRRSFVRGRRLLTFSHTFRAGLVSWTCAVSTLWHELEMYNNFSGYNVWLICSPLRLKTWRWQLMGKVLNPGMGDVRRPSDRHNCPHLRHNDTVVATPRCPNVVERYGRRRGKRGGER
jgi:hypothetical protein